MLYSHYNLLKSIKMTNNLDDFYSERSERFSVYAFKSKAKIIKGKKPDFFKLIKKHSARQAVALDLGCGSGELTLKLSSCFKNIIGIDPFEKYIETAKKNKRRMKIKNITFEVADGKKLPFPKEYFDLVYSSRGPLSSATPFLNEALRVLKKGGLLIEETIGEKDKLELKKIFRRGQNYPFKKTKVKEIQELLKKVNLHTNYIKNFIYFQEIESLNAVINLLDRAPIIPDFDLQKDKKCIGLIQKELLSKNKIVLSAHRLHWISKKIHR